MKLRGRYPNASNWLRHRSAAYPTLTVKRTVLARFNEALRARGVDAQLHPTKGWRRG